MLRPVISSFSLLMSLIDHFVNSRLQLFKRWIVLFTGLITFQRIRVGETNCVTQWRDLSTVYRCPAMV